MSAIISKEVLSEVLSFDCIMVINGSADNDILYRNSKKAFSINIYELAHKCKEKAREYGYSITTGNRLDRTDRYDVLCIHKDEDIECDEAIFLSEIVDTEPTGCFMAMQWILDNKDNQ